MVSSEASTALQNPTQQGDSGACVCRSDPIEARKKGPGWQAGSTVLVRRGVCGVHKMTEMGEEQKEADRRGRLILVVAS